MKYYILYDFKRKIIVYSEVNRVYMKVDIALHKTYALRTKNFAHNYFACLTLDDAMKNLEVSRENIYEVEILSEIIRVLPKPSVQLHICSKIKVLSKVK